jgi:Dicer dimerisation domain
MAAAVAAGAVKYIQPQRRAVVLLQLLLPLPALLTVTLLLLSLLWCVWHNLHNARKRMLTLAPASPISTRSLSPAFLVRSTLLQPYFSCAAVRGGFHSTVYLPSNCGVSPRVQDAPAGRSASESKQLAALHVLRLLHEAGKLDDHLRPVWVTPRHGWQLGALGSAAVRAMAAQS